MGQTSQRAAKKPFGDTAEKKEQSRVESAGNGLLCADGASILRKWLCKMRRKRRKRVAKSRFLKMSQTQKKSHCLFLEWDTVISDPVGHTPSCRGAAGPSGTEGPWGRREGASRSAWTGRPRRWGPARMRETTVEDQPAMAGHEQYSGYSRLANDLFAVGATMTTGS